MLGCAFVGTFAEPPKAGNGMGVGAGQDFSPWLELAGSLPHWSVSSPGLGLGFSMGCNSGSW